MKLKSMVCVFLLTGLSSGCFVYPKQAVISKPADEKLQHALDGDSSRKKPISVSIIDGDLTAKSYVDGKGPLLFVLDSGGGGSHTISFSAAETIGLKLGRKFKGRSASNTMSMRTVGVRRFAFENGFEHKGKLSATNHPLGSGWANTDSAEMVGTLGSPLFTKYIVEIDFSQNEMFIYEPKHWTVPLGAQEIAVSVGLFSHIASRKVTINGVKAKLLVDTGAFAPIIINV